jgi:hypothetical protein
MSNKIINIAYKQVEKENQKAMQSRLQLKKDLITFLNSKYLFMGNDVAVSMHINQIIQANQKKEN